MLLVPVFFTVEMYEIMSCFIFEFENPYHFPEMLLYDKQFENDSDLNDYYKI